MKKITFLELAEKVLEEAQKPLTHLEMWEIAIQKGWEKLAPTGGKTPWSTLGARLYVDVLTKDSPFEVIGTRPKKFILKGMAYDDEIAKLHEEIYLFLQQHKEKNPTIYFLLRDSDTYSRLEKGYWFWGNNEYLVISCWKRKDTIKDYRNIALYVEKDGTCILRFCATDDEKKAKILKILASFIPNMKALKEEGQEVAIWEKRYETTDYLANIQYFIEKEKAQIDSILELASGELFASFEPVSADVFEKNVVRIEALRKVKDEPEIIEEISHFELPYLLLKKLSIENIGIFSQLEIDFSERLTVLIGENGIGKTTILRAIALALAGINENSLLDARHFKIQNLLRIENEVHNNVLYAEKGRIYLAYHFENKPYQNTLLFSADKYGVKVEDDGNSDFTSVTNDTFPHLVIGFSQAQNSDTPLTVKQIPYAKLAAIKEAHVKDLLPLLYNQADNRFEAFTDWIVNLYNLGNQKLVENPLLKTVRERQLIHFVFEMISEIIETTLTFKSIKLANGKDTQNIIWIEDDTHKKMIPLHLISQGFNSIFGWVGYFMMRMEEASHTLDTSQLFDNEENTVFSHWKNTDHAICLIDEIDTYLHPKWQRKVLKVLVEKFPNTQFVVTTHSPLVLATSDNDKTIAYRIKQDSAERISYFYGTRIQDLMYEEYGIKERPAQEMQDKINTLFDALYAEDAQKETYEPLYQELLAALGEDDLAMLDAKYLIQEKEGI